MRFIHTSDLHINSPLTSHLTPSKTRERKDELLHSFRILTEEAMALSADAVIIAGDLFDSERISQKALTSVIASIERAKSITFFYLAGNHEKSALIDTGMLLPDNLKVFSEDWTYFEICNVMIVGRQKTSADMFKTLRLSDKAPSVTVLHGELRDYSDAGGIIGVRDAECIECDYMALGHYHTFKERKINKRCTAVYSGTPEGRGFDEVGDKGYVVVDIDEKGVSYSFKKRAKRTIHAIEVDITGAKTQYEIESLIEHAAKRAVRDDVVRIILTGEHETNLERDTSMLQRFFEDRYFYFEVIDKSRLKIDLDDFKLDKSLKGEFVRVVMASEELSDDEKSAIIECGISALMGEEIKR